ncbi:hypothetical protein [Reichenbachiella sp. MALMAid0571]|uniref:hypothetical protein n=1 Tax=Reichenbachiella sp. MALMAid0571 TaxID=3143939 RepID=UPI0032DF0D69
MKLHDSLSKYRSKVNFTEQHETVPKNHNFLYYYNEKLTVRERLPFKKCQFLEKVEILCGFDVEFHDCVFLKGFILSLNSNGNISFYNCFFEDEPFISELHPSHSHHLLRIDNCTFNENISFKPQSLSHLQITNCKIKELTDIKNVYTLDISGLKTRIGNLKLELKAQVKEAKFHSHCIIERLSVIGGWRFNLALDYCQINTLSINRGFDSITANHLISNKIGFSHISFYENRLPSSIKISGGSEIDELEISEYKASGEIFIGSSEIDNLKLKSINKNSSIVINRLSNLNYLSFEDIDCNVSLSEITIEQLSLRNCNFDFLKFGYIHWSRNFSLKSSNNSIDESDQYLELIETSRQLKLYLKT